MKIERYLDVAMTRQRHNELDSIFFESSSIQTFGSDDDRRAFRTRWLGRYLERFPGDAYLAVDDAGTVAGYLVGCRVDPATEPMFDDIAYFPQVADLTRRYPAHLHINLAPSSRSRGIGGQLIARFVGDLEASGGCGVHVVTSEGARNVRFYEREGFRALRTLEWHSGPLVFLARDIGR